MTKRAGSRRTSPSCRELLTRYRWTAWWLGCATGASFLQFDCILYFLAALFWLEQGFCDIALLCIRHGRPFRRDQVRHTAVVGMLANAFATKRFTRNRRVKQKLYQLSDFRKRNTRCNAAKRVEKTIKQHVMPFLPPLTHATKFWRSTYCSIRLAACSCCRTAS